MCGTRKIKEIKLMCGTTKIKETKMYMWNKKDNGDMAICIRDKIDCSKWLRNQEQ